ncbi:MAG: hypothetical protein HQ463_05300 [Bacteroidetes bacterium]|nr:hypothetical protein [Bacteroidota bacterium]
MSSYKKEHKILEMENKLNILEQIQKVEANPYLFNKIENRINQQITNFISLKLSWSLGFLFLLVFAVNILVIKNQGRKNEQISISKVAKALHLNTNNNLYE